MRTKASVFAHQNHRGNSWIVSYRGFTYEEQNEWLCVTLYISGAQKEARSKDTKLLLTVKTVTWLHRSFTYYQQTE